MHNNYYFLRQLSSQLRSNLISYQVAEIYSQQKNELTICLYKENNEAYIRAHLDSEFSCLSFPENASRARRNSVDLFTSIYDLEIIDIVQVDNDRSFYFKFEDGSQLLFKMHGNRSNIILIIDNKTRELFRNNLKQDHEISMAELAKNLNFSHEHFCKENGNYRAICPTLGTAFEPYFQKHQYQNLNLVEQYSFFSGLLKLLEAPTYFIHIDVNQKPVLTFFQVSEKDLTFSDPILAINALYKLFISDYQLEKEKSKMRNGIQDQIKKSEAYIRKTQGKLDKLKKSDSYQHIGDLIMANLYQIKPYASDVELVDFYSQAPVKISLKPSLSPQANAEKYYKKAKKQQIEIDNLSKNIKAKKDQITDLVYQIDEIENITKIKQLRKEKKNKELNTELPYYQVSFMNYEILIGRNARKNDILTFNVAAKDDLFLHAKDTPGSHVIIRKKNNQNIPAMVIEKAASYAAFHSKNKTESLIRVLYTPKKYVRKAKGTPAGTVIVLNEKVILVKPENFKK